MARKQWFGWVVHARQERGDYMALVAIVATFGVGMIAVGSYLAEAEKHHFPHWLANVLLIAGVAIILLMVVVALILGALPFFTRPKLRLGRLSLVPYTDAEAVAEGAKHGGLESATCMQVEVHELRGVKAREVEVWVTALDPEPSAMPVALPVPVEVFDLSNSIRTDIPAKNRQYFKLWVKGNFKDGGAVSWSRIGAPMPVSGTIALDSSRELDARRPNLRDS